MGKMNARSVAMDIPNGSTKVLNALNIKNESRNLSFIDEKKILTNEANIKELDILFKKIT